MYIIVIAFELVTIFLSLLLSIFSLEDRPKVYLTFIGLTCVRVVIFLGNSIYMIGVSK